MSDMKELVRQSVNKMDFIKCLITYDPTLKEVATSLENIKEQIEE